MEKLNLSYNQKAQFIKIAGGSSFMDSLKQMNEKISKIDIEKVIEENNIDIEATNKNGLKGCSGIINTNGEVIQTESVLNNTSTGGININGFNK